jgi:primosomal protein N' (replication factor Y)
MRTGQKTRFARRLRRNMTPAERLLWWKLRDEQQGWRFLRQHPVGTFVADFACIETLLAIEIDGATHSKPEEIAHDRARTNYLERNGWRVIRFWNADIFNNLAGVIASIHLAATEQQSWMKHNQRE